MKLEQPEKQSKYLYEDDSLKKEEIDISQVLLDIQNHIKDDEPFEYDRTILDKKNFIVTPNSIERIRKISYYISRGVPVLLEGPSGTSKTFSTEFSCLVAKTKRPLIRFNMSSDTVPADLLGKMVGDKNSLAGISSQEGHFLKAFKYGHPLLLDEINLASQAVLQCIEEALDSEVISIEIPGFPLTTEINEELMNIDFNAVQDEQNTEENNPAEPDETQAEENQNEEGNNMNEGEGENNFEEFQDMGEEYLNFENVGESEDLNLNQGETGMEGEGEGAGEEAGEPEGNQDIDLPNEEGHEENNSDGGENAGLHNVDNNQDFQ